MSVCWKPGWCECPECGPLVERSTDAQSAIWHDWLAAIGYGIDSSNDAPPPCTRRELAEAYHRADPSASVAEWEWCIDENTGATFGGVERSNLAELLDELEAEHGPVPQEEIDRALAMWPDSSDGAA